MLIKLENVSLAFGFAPLLDKIQCQIDPGERVCLIGRNGEGKSTLLKVIDGALETDEGSIWRKPGLRIGRLTQELPRDVQQTVLEYISEGVDPHQEEWQQQKVIHNILSHLSLDADSKVCDLSGGWQRRAALARALACEPELLLLDEPTNHLDIDAIQWLEEYLVKAKHTIVFITHDRSLLQRLATRIMELDRGQLTSWPGDYENYLRRREERLHAESLEHAHFDKKLAQEEVWIRQGIKARRTRNEGRVRALKALREKRTQRRELQGTANMNINQGDTSGKIVVTAEHCTHQFGDKLIIKDFNFSMMRGDKIGLVGPNGVGKTTLIKLLLGQLQADSGVVKQGTKLEVAYFDQMRESLDLTQTAVDNVAEGSLSVTVAGREKHVIGYLGDFLFSPERARMKISAFSGGELNRLLLAKLFSKSFNLLVMDEPTNDLDIESLELLESLLVEYTGTLLLISHDRTFLNNVVTSFLLFKGDGIVQESLEEYQPVSTDIVTASKSKPNKPKSQANKLNFREQKELKSLPKKIEQLEAKKEALQAEMAAPDFYAKGEAVTQPILARYEEVNQAAEIAFSRWDELEAKDKI